MYQNASLVGLKLDKGTQVADAILESEVQDKEANDLFNEAVQLGWNLEMDWLWLATKVTRFSQRYYCLEQALIINPESQLAKQGLKMLKSNPGQMLKF